MTFNKIRSYHLHEYLISCCDGFVLDFDLKLSCNLDPDEMVLARIVLDIIMRLSKDLKLTTSCKVLYCSLARPIIEYGALL